jgi:SAM-dependent methyltransferase
MAVIAPPAPADAAVAGYEALAPYYDAFTAGYDHEAWIAALEALAMEHGLAGRRALDVACGTGKSFLPLLERGYSVTACDISPAMVELARGKVGDVDVHVADMRALPDLGTFDFITCLDDSVNYLLEEGELVAALRSMGRRLAERGLLVFDCNSATTYRTAFRQQFVRESGDQFFSWRGDGSEIEGLASATIDVFARAGEGWERSTSLHIQRHYSRRSVESALRQAGLELAAVRGQSPGARLDLEVDEERHTKIVYLARHARRAQEGGKRGHPSVIAT